MRGMIHNMQVTTLTQCFDDVARSGTFSPLSEVGELLLPAVSLVRDQRFLSLTLHPTRRTFERLWSLPDGNKVNRPAGREVLFFVLFGTSVSGMGFAAGFPRGTKPTTPKFLMRGWFFLFWDVPPFFSFGPRDFQIPG